VATGKTRATNGTPGSDLSSISYDRPPLRPIVYDLLLNAAVPTAVFAFGRRAGLDEVPALLWAAVVPAAIAAIGLARKRTIDPIAAIAIVSIVVSIIGAEIGGGPKVLLIRESFVTGALGLLCLVSLALPRPLMFYFGRWFATRGEPAAVAAFNARWADPMVRRTTRLITIVWAGAFVGEFVLRVLLVFTLPAIVVLAVAPVLLGAITLATIVWTYRYIALARRRSA